MAGKQPKDPKGSLEEMAITIHGFLYVPQLLWLSEKAICVSMNIINNFLKDIESFNIPSGND